MGGTLVKMSGGRSWIQSGYFLVAALAALMLVPQVRSWAWLIVIVIIAVSSALVAAVLHENRIRARRSNKGE